MHCLHNYLDGRICSCNVEHAEGRGANLKNTETYTYVMTDLIHKAFAYAASVQERTALSLVAVMAEPLEKILRRAKSEWDPRHYVGPPVARVDYGTDYLWHDGTVKSLLVDDPMRIANREAWSDLFRDAATQSFILKDINAGVELAKMSERTDALALARTSVNAHSPSTSGFLKEAPVEAFDVLYCPGKPAVNYLFFGDSFNALIRDGARTDIGTILKESKRSLFGSKHEVWADMTWGQGLTQALDATERALIKLAERPEPRPHVITISWSGNDVVGRNGYIDNPAALAGWATDTEAKRVAATKILERNATAVMTARERLHDLALREDVLQVVVVIPQDHDVYGLTESYQTQMAGHARILSRRARVTVLNPQTLINNTSRSDRVHVDDTERNRKNYIQYFVAAAKLGHDIGQIERVHWFQMERDYLDLSIPIFGASPQETGGPASAKNPEDPFDNKVREQELAAVSKVAAKEPKLVQFLQEEKEINPMYPLDTQREEQKVLAMMQPEIHQAVHDGHLDEVLEWTSSESEGEDGIKVYDLPPGYTPKKASRPKGQAVMIPTVDASDVGEDGQIKLMLSAKPKTSNKMTESLAASTPKAKAKAMPKATITPASSSAQPGEIRGPEPTPKPKAAPKAANRPGETRGPDEVKKEWVSCAGISIPALQDRGRSTFLSIKLSYLIRGHAQQWSYQSVPEIDLSDLSFDYNAVVKWIQKRYDWHCTQYTLLQAAAASKRFQVYIEHAPTGMQWNGLKIMPLRIRSITGHNDWVSDATGYSHIPGALVTLDESFTIEEAKRGIRPRFNLDFTDARRKALPQIAYHTCTMQDFFGIIYMGIFPGGMGDRQSSRGHAYLTVVPPWDRIGRKAGGARADRHINIAVDIEMLTQLGCRLFAPGDGEALVTEDWVTNKCFIYAYDSEAAKFIWSNRMYVELRRNYIKKIKKFHDEKKAGGEVESLLNPFMAKIDVESKSYYSSWGPKACMDISKPQIIGRATKAKGVYDENLPPNERVELPFETARYALYRNWAKTVQQQPGETHGRSVLADDLNPNKGKSKNWRYAEIMLVPDEECSVCGLLNPCGAIHCFRCDNLQERMPDVKKLARVVRLEEMSNQIGVPLTMDQLETQILTQHKEARGDRSGRGGLGIMKDIAKKSVNRSREYKNLYERLTVDPFYSYSAARGDLTPVALEFIEKIARCVIPGIERTRDMIKGKVAAPKYAARLALVPPLDDDAAEVNPQDVYVYHGGRFLNAEQFAALYGNLSKEQRYPVMGWTKDFTSLGNCETVLCDLLCFVESEVPEIDVPGRSKPLPGVVGVTNRPIPQLRETGSPWHGHLGTAILGRLGTRLELLIEFLVAA